MGICSQASLLAAQTPASRNRYVDFLRGLSILFVISGHWLITTAYYDRGTCIIWGLPGGITDWVSPALLCCIQFWHWQYCVC